MNFENIIQCFQQVMFIIKLFLNNYHLTLDIQYKLFSLYWYQVKHSGFRDGPDNHCLQKLHSQMMKKNI